MDKATTTLVVLGATVLGMYNVVQVAEIMNKKRDVVLGINKDGERLTAAQKKILLYSDYVPFMLGLLFFLAVYAIAFYQLPYVLDEKARTQSVEAGSAGVPFTVSNIERWGCWAASAFVAFAFIVVLVIDPIEIWKMRRHINNTPECRSGETVVDATLERLERISALSRCDRTVSELLNELTQIEDTARAILNREGAAIEKDKPPA